MNSDFFFFKPTPTWIFSTVQCGYLVICYEVGLASINLSHFSIFKVFSGTAAKMAIIKKCTINAREGVERREPSYTVGGNAIWCSHYGKHYAAAAKLLQSCPTLCNPINGSPPGSSVPGILQARTLEWVAISFSNAGKWRVKVKSLSRVRLLATPWTAAYQAPPSMGIFQARVLEWGAIAFSACKTCL